MVTQPRAMCTQPTTSQFWDSHILPSALPSPVGDKGLLAVPQNSPLYCLHSSLLHPPQGFDQLSPSQGGTHMLNSPHTSVFPVLSTTHYFFPYNSSSSNTQVIIFIVICLLQTKCKLLKGRNLCLSCSLMSPVP